jgi:hypothetical protein
MTKRTKHMRKRAIGLREPNGRLSRRAKAVSERRANAERDVMRPAVEARMRVFGISEADARRQEGGTVLGRMYQAKAITLDQCRAGERYAEVRNAYHRAIGAQPDGGHPPAEGNGDGDYATFCANARKTHEAMMSALQSLCQEQRSPAPISALDVFIVRDIHHSLMVGDLRLALNCLHRHFGGDKPVARLTRSANHPMMSSTT